jgi:hypothetical protein
VTAFALAGQPGTYRLEIDGLDCANQVQAVTVKVGAEGFRGNDFAEVVLVLAGIHQPDMDLPDADVRVDDDTAALLVRLGWTPPKEITR